MLISGECLAKEDFRGRSVTRVRIDKNASLQQLRLGISFLRFYSFDGEVERLHFESFNLHPFGVHLEAVHVCNIGWPDPKNGKAKMHTRAVCWVALESVFEILVANMLKTTTLKTNNFKKSRSKNGGNLRNEPSTTTLGIKENCNAIRTCLKARVK